MLKRYFLKLTYNGANYCGWQEQPHAPSVQGTVESVLQRLFGFPIKLVGCGRTDAGVHASCYFAHVDLVLPFSEEQLVYKLNKMLPNDIAVDTVILVPDDAHARFDATERSYNYFIHQNKNPFITEFSWYYPHKLDIDAMNSAARLLVGKKDFTSFSKLHTDVKTNICDLTYASCKLTNEGGLVFEITANRFLRNMVRAVVGTLIDVGKGKLSPEDILIVLAAKNRSRAGVSVPAHGLFLSRIKYPYIN